MSGTKQKVLNAFFEVNEIRFGVFIESRITNNCDDDSFLKQCSPQDPFFTMHLELIKEDLEFALFTDLICN